VEGTSLFGMEMEFCWCVGKAEEYREMLGWCGSWSTWAKTRRIVSTDQTA
jgi:hypothetical protein